MLDNIAAHLAEVHRFNVMSKPLQRYALKVAKQQ